MTEPQHREEPEPPEPEPAGPWYVPVRPCPSGYTVRLFRTPLGARTAVAFTSPRALGSTLGAAQPWIRLALPALRAVNQLPPDGVVVDGPRVVLDRIEDSP